VEDYSTSQLENIAKKLLELAGLKMEDIVAKSFCEINRLNYGYALVIKEIKRTLKILKNVLKITKQQTIMVKNTNHYFLIRLLSLH